MLRFINSRGELQYVCRSLNPLIAHNWQNLVQVLSLLLFGSTVFLLGFLCRKLERALFFTLLTSSVIFLLFVIT